MSRQRYVRLDADRLQEAIRAAGLTKTEFGRKCTRIMEKRGLWGEDKHDDKSISSWVSLLLRKDSRQQGVHPELLDWLEIILHVNADWLTGETECRTYQDKLLAIQAAARDKENDYKNQMKSTRSMYKRSPVSALIKDRVLSLHVTSPAKLSFTLSEDPRVSYEIDAKTLRMMEKACEDLCVSLIKNSYTFKNFS